MSALLKKTTKHDLPEMTELNNERNTQLNQSLSVFWLLQLISWLRTPGFLLPIVIYTSSLTPEILALVQRPFSPPTDGLSNLKLFYLRRNTSHCPQVTVVDIQGGSYMTGTNCDLFTHKYSRSYLNQLVLAADCWPLIAPVATRSGWRLTTYSLYLPPSSTKPLGVWGWGS
jgi:hypothetical protein